MEQLTAGFETERFVNQPIREAFCCSICFGVLRDAVQCPSEHAFCRTCISIWLSGSNTCPMDRTELSSSQLVQLPRAIRGMIDELEIKCEFANYGCNQTSLLQNYAKFDIHISACLYRSIKQDKERIASLETGMKTIAALVADDVIVVEMSVDELTNLIITKIGEKDFELTELKSVEAEEARMMMGAIISEQSSSKESLENQLALLRVENLENQEEIRQLREYKQKFEDKEREFDEFRQNLERTIRNPTSPRASAPPVSSFDPGSRLVSPSAMQARVFGDLTDSFPISSKVLEALKRVDFGEFNSDLGRNESSEVYFRTYMGLERLADLVSTQCNALFVGTNPHFVACLTILMGSQGLSHVSHVYLTSLESHCACLMRTSRIVFFNPLDDNESNGFATGCPYDLIVVNSDAYVTGTLRSQLKSSGKIFSCNDCDFI